MVLLLTFNAEIVIFISYRLDIRYRLKTTHTQVYIIRTRNKVNLRTIYTIEIPSENPKLDGFTNIPSALNSNRDRTQMAFKPAQVRYLYTRLRWFKYCVKKKKKNFMKIEYYRTVTIARRTIGQKLSQGWPMGMRIYSLPIRFKNFTRDYATKSTIINII